MFVRLEYDIIFCPTDKIDVKTFSIVVQWNYKLDLKLQESYNL